jgi:hypothetical protein
MACLGSGLRATTSTGISQPADSAGGNVRASAENADADITAAARFSAARQIARSSSCSACFGDEAWPTLPASINGNLPVFLFPDTEWEMTCAHRHCSATFGDAVWPTLPARVKLRLLCTVS